MVNMHVISQILSITVILSAGPLVIVFLALNVIKA